MSALTSLEVSVCLLVCEILLGLECVCLECILCSCLACLCVLLHDFYPLAG